jgi:very-short-patch-repair endonuclease
VTGKKSPLPLAGEGWVRAISPQARRLRQEMTDAVRIIWAELRGRRLGGHKFKRQWTVGPYIADFCCIEQRLIVEIDGGQYSDAADGNRTQHLDRLGYRIVRFWNHDVMDNLDGVSTTILAALETDPHPGPLPRAGEGD